MKARKQIFLFSLLWGAVAMVLHGIEGFSFFYAERLYYTDHSVCSVAGVGLLLLWWWRLYRKARQNEKEMLPLNAGLKELLTSVCCLLVALSQVLFGIRFLKSFLTASQPLLHAAVGLLALPCAVAMVLYALDLLFVTRRNPPLLSCLPSAWFGLCMVDIFAEYSTACPIEENFWQMGCCISAALLFLRLGELLYSTPALPAGQTVIFLPAALFCLSTNLPNMVLCLLRGVQPSAFPKEMQILYVLVGLLGLCLYTLVIPAPAEEEPAPKHIAATAKNKFLQKIIDFLKKLQNS